MKKFLLLFAFVIAISISNAQPLSGTKTIGIAGDYADIPTAVTALITNGISADVTFNIKTSATAYMATDINITTFTGHGLFSVTFQAESGNASDVKIENSLFTFYVFHCAGVDNITFKNLSLKSNSGTRSNIFLLDYDADNITIENCKLTGNLNGSVESQYSLIYVDDVIASDNTNCDNLIVRNCLLDGGKVGITVNGNSSGGGNPRNQGLIIENDSIVNQKQIGIKLYYCSTHSIKNNLIKPTTITSPTSMYEGISLAYCDGNYTLENNQIYINNANPSGNLYGIYIEYSNHVTITNNTDFGKLINNMIHLNGGGPGSDAIGIFIQDCNYTELLHNTIRTTADGSEDYCVKFNSSNDIIFKNNLLQVGTIPLLINKDGATTLTSDYNVYFGFNGIGTNDNGTTFPNTLANWQIATGLDANSIYKQVTFYGDYSNLELSAKSVADVTLRVPRLTNVTTDVYAKARLNPTIAGAFERYGPMNGLYIIDNSLPYPSPSGSFVSYGKAIQALASGVSGPVSFEAVGGSDYEEQIEIFTISGASSTNTINFNKTALSPFPTLKYATTSLLDNYVVRLDSVQHISFANTYFSNSTAVSGLGKVFEIINGSSNISFLGCNFYGVMNPGSSFSDASLIFASSQLPHSDINNVSITGSQFFAGDYGIYVYGDNTNANGWYIHNNDFSMQTFAAINLNYVLDAEISINRILGNSANLMYNYFGINCYYCDGNLNLEKNKITLTALSPAATLSQAIHISQYNPIYSSDFNRGTISNNMIRVTNDASREANGITLFETAFKNVYHNTVVTDVTNNLGHPLKITTVLDSIKIKNNIFIAYGNEPVAYVDLSTTKLIFNYNNLKTQGANLVNINATNMSLVTMQGLGYNLNFSIDSVIFTNPFAIPNDLHLTGTSKNNANLKGTNISAFTTTDFDGDVRDFNSPFMGADEGCGNPLTLSPTAPATITVCEGLPILTAGTNYSGSLLWYTVASGGVGASNPPGGLTGVNTIYVSEKFGNCESPRTAIVVEVTTGAEISGAISVNSTAVTSGTVFLFKQNIVDNRMDTVATQTLSSTNYLFANLPAGNYLVGFKPNAVSNPNTPSTFNGDQNSWANASLIAATCANTYTININATSLTALSGPGSISGKIQQGTGFGKTDLVGDPIPGVDISLEQNPGGIMVAQTQSDANGLYSFTNLPLDDYRVRVSIPGTEHTAYYDVTIDAANPIEDNLIYVVDSNSIYPLSVINMQNSKKEINSITVIPNPFTNEATLLLPKELHNKTITIVITDISGKIVSESTLENKSKINIKRNDLENGLYFIKIQSETTTHTQKIIIQ